MADLGPLTDTFTPASECNTVISGKVHTQTLDDGNTTTYKYHSLGPSATSSCYPPGFEAPSGFYSPGICPSGWESACGSIETIGSATETRAMCCPRGYSCMPSPDATATWSTLSCISANIGGPLSVTVPDVSNQQSMVVELDHILINAAAVNVRWQRNDFFIASSTSAPTSSSTTSTTSTTSATPITPTTSTTSTVSTISTSSTTSAASTTSTTSISSTASTSTTSTTSAPSLTSVSGSGQTATSSTALPSPNSSNVSTELPTRTKIVIGATLGVVWLGLTVAALWFWWFRRKRNKVKARGAEGPGPGPEEVTKPPVEMWHLFQPEMQTASNTHEMITTSNIHEAMADSRPVELPSERWM
ncbi:hypothetical protein GGR54DRAFT_209272 [Hypoxylon sp. NC1633]|nr:hypothetical protein GGR54DRAFT_209272 [Hypoxylon sp. NC1633]